MILGQAQAAVFGETWERLLARDHLLPVIPSAAEESARSDSGEHARHGEDQFEPRMRSRDPPGPWQGTKPVQIDRRDPMQLSPLPLRVDSSASLGMT